jgi:hypothetical protein
MYLDLGVSNICSPYATEIDVIRILDRADEIGRRGGLFYVGLNLGSLTAGLIQSSASANLDGVAGLEGWR